MKISKKILAAAFASAMAISTAVTPLTSFAMAAVEEAEIEEPVAPLTVAPYIGSYVSVSDKTEISDDAAITEKLAEITLKVKQTLGIGDEYTNFYGDSSDNGKNRIWYLNWDKDDERLNISAAEDGTVMRYNMYKYSDENYTYNNFYSPKFPNFTREDAKKVAESFLNRILRLEESYEIKDYNDYYISTQDSNYYFNVILKVNGLETPITASVNVSQYGYVSSFYRNDMYSSYYGGFDEVSVNYDAKTAFKSLSKKYESDIQYYLYYDENDKENKNPKAELRYTFNSTGDWFVNCKTGEVVDRNKLYDSVFGTETAGGYAGSNYDDAVTEEAEMEEPAPMANKASLTEVEKQGIEKLEGVLSGEELTKILNEKYPEFGLDGFELNSTSYNVYGEDDDYSVDASISYVFRVTKASQIGMTEAGFKEYTNNKQIFYIRKYLTVNAKTGELIDYYTSRPYYNEKYDSGMQYNTATKAFAEQFLEKNFPNEFAQVQLADTYENNVYDTVSYTYYQYVNGYKFDVNNIYITVDMKTGDIDTFSVNWVDNVKFGSADNIISADEAVAAYTKALETKLSYIEIPVAIDDSKPDMLYYVNNGYGYVTSFVAAYQLKNTDGVYAVKASNGEVVKYDYYNNTGIVALKDIDSSANKDKLEKLAEYGISFRTEYFKPETLITQKDMLVLLLNANGYSYSEDNYDSEYFLDDLYSSAKYAGFNIVRNENATVTLKDAIKTLISATEYGAAAKLKGIFKTGYADENKLSEEDIPYIAIAKALGLTKADNNNNINADSILTREDFAVILYNFLDRE